MVWLSGNGPIVPQLIGFVESRLGLVVGWCWQHWPGQDDVLVVVDDVQDYGALKLLLPSAFRFRVLLTTRRSILGVRQRLELEVLLMESALEMLRELVGDKRIDGELAAAGTLCEVLGRLPLGIELVGWYLAKRPDLTIAQLLKRLDEKKLAAQALIKTSKDCKEMRADLGVAATFELSWEPLGENEKTLAGLFGLFAAATVQWKWVQDCLETMEEEDLQDAQVELLELHLLRRVEGGYQVHPLLREFFGGKLGELTVAEDLQGRFTRGMVEITKTIPYNATVADRGRVTAAVPHLKVVAADWTDCLEGIDKLWCCGGLARFYESLSLWTEAERCWERSMAISKEQLGDRHPDTATSLNNLARLYVSMGRYESAEPLYLEALEILKEKLDDRHPNTIQGKQNFITLYESWLQSLRQQNRHDEALIILEKMVNLRSSWL